MARHFREVRNLTTEHTISRPPNPVSGILGIQGALAELVMSPVSTVPEPTEKKVVRTHRSDFSDVRRVQEFPPAYKFLQFLRPIMRSRRR